MYGDKLEELKRKLNVSLFYEFYFESIIIELKIIITLINKILVKYNVFVNNI